MPKSFCILNRLGLLINTHASTSLYMKTHSNRAASTLFLALSLFWFSLSRCARPETKEESWSADLHPKRGLFASWHGLGVVRGSTFRFATAQNGRVFYDFSWIYQPKSQKEGVETLRIGGPNSFVDGTYVMKRSEGALEFALTGTWKRADSTLLLFQAGKIWLPAFASGTLSYERLQKRIVDLDVEGFMPEALDTDSLSFLELKGGLGSLRIEFPGRDGQIRFANLKGMPANPWVAGPPVLKVSLSSERYAPGDAFEKKVRMIFRPATESPLKGKNTAIYSSIPEKAAWKTVFEGFPLLPKPKTSNLEASATTVLLVDKAKPLSGFDSLFGAALQRIWDVPVQAYSNLKATVSPSTGLPAEGFRLDIAPASIQVNASDSTGLRHAAAALAFLVRSSGGRLMLPKGTVTDYPSGPWRGIHMFVGPKALPFHKAMYEKILFPLRMNKVVLQCEQTDWSSLPKIRNPITMPLEDLRKEAEFLRANRVELIPLIQSFGHMEWFFENGQNLDLATNPEIPYTIHVEKERARQALKVLWDEAVSATGARTLHFGLDEVDMIGWPKRDPEEITRLWEWHLPFLSSIAKEHQAAMMLWGDMILGPGESIDFSNAETRVHAERRRAVLPKGAYIADWHYKADPEPANYAPSLDVLTGSGFQPVASTWFFPNNIRGFNLAAIDRNMGTLQTTWADFESSEANMLKYLPQFGAYILSLDYAWSGRKEIPEALPYDPIALWARMFYHTPQPIRAKEGLLLGAPEDPEVHCGPWVFKQWRSDSRQPMKEEEIRLKVPALAGGIALLLGCSAYGEENEALAEVELVFTDGSRQLQQIRYGVHARAESDPRPILSGHTESRGQSGVYFSIEHPREIKQLVLRHTHPLFPLKIQGLTLIR
jgi:hypothetical protein